MFSFVNDHIVYNSSMSKDTPLRLAVDFDSVIHDPANKLPGYKLGVPISGAVEALQGLKKEGAIIVIHSVWGNTEKKCQTIAEWCRYFKVPYDFITNEKVVADFYIDNHGLFFQSWPQTLAEIKERHPGS